MSAIGRSQKSVGWRRAPARQPKHDRVFRPPASPSLRTDRSRNRAARQVAEMPDGAEPEGGGSLSHHSVCRYDSPASDKLVDVGQPLEAGRSGDRDAREHRRVARQGLD